MSTQAEVAPPELAYTSWEAVLAYLDEWTSDGRRLASSGMTVRPLPLTLSFMPATDDGHDGAFAIGKIDEVWTAGTKLMGRGTFDSSPEAQDAARQIDEQVQREVSIDPTVQEYVATYPLDWKEEVVIDEQGNEVVEVTENVQDYGVTFTVWELAGATVVSGAAFTGTEITVTADGDGAPTASGIFGATRIETPRLAPVTAAAGDTVGMLALYPTPDEAAALAQTGTETADTVHLTLAVFQDALPDAALLDGLLTEFAAAQPALAGDVTGVAVFAAGPDGVPVVALADVLGLAELRTALCDVLEAAAIPFAVDHDFVPHITLDYADPATTVDGTHPAIGLPLTFAAVSFSPLDDTARTDYPLAGSEASSEDAEDTGVTASAAGMAPLHPPAEWFDYPGFTGPTPITVTPEGHIYGHFAPFDVCHVGRSGSCLNARQLTSRAGYAYFHTGYVLTDDGREIPTGPLVMGTTHPDVRAGVQEAQRHYCDTGLVAADVRVGDDEWGQWMSGALRPDVPAERVRELRGSAPSGDWKPIAGAVELIGILAVNTPGFPQVRIAASADEPLAAVAVGSYTPGELDSYLSPVLSDGEAAIRLRVARARIGGLDGLRELLPR